MMGGERTEQNNKEHMHATKQTDEKSH